VRILIAHSFYRLSGGEDSYVRHQVDLLDREHSVCLMAGRNEELGSTFRTFGRMLFSRAKEGEVKAAMRDFDPDIVHVHNAYPALGPAVHLAAKELGIPLVQTVHNFRMRCPNGYMFTEGQLCNRCEKGAYLNAVVHNCFPSKKQAAAYAGALWTHRFLLRLERQVRIFVTPSRFIHDCLVGWGVPEERVRTIPHFIEPYPGASSLPGDHGIYVGRLSSEKGVDTLLRALRMAEDPPFLVVGDGPLKEPLQTLARELGLRNTRFTGRMAHDQVEQTLEGSRFVAIPSLWHEPFGLVALEAMALGRPLLVTRRGCLPEFVSSGAGLLCEAENPVGMATQISHLFQDDDLCAEMGARGITLSLSDFHPSRHLDRLLTAYGADVGPASSAPTGGS
jgi:glycosyltransferase involved in cell wall biosynthesis